MAATSNHTKKCWACKGTGTDPDFEIEKGCWTCGGDGVFISESFPHKTGCKNEYYLFEDTGIRCSKCKAFDPYHSEDEAE